MIPRAARRYTLRGKIEKTRIRRIDFCRCLHLCVIQKRVYTVRLGETGGCEETVVQLLQGTVV